MSRVGDDDHEQALYAEVALRTFKERDMAHVRWVEHPAEDQSQWYSRVSSPTTTSSPERTPAWRNASSSSAWLGAVPDTR